MVSVIDSDSCDLHDPSLLQLRTNGLPGVRTCSKIASSSQLWMADGADRCFSRNRLPSPGAKQTTRPDATVIRSAPAIDDRNTFRYLRNSVARKSEQNLVAGLEPLSVGNGDGCIRHLQYPINVSSGTCRAPGILIPFTSANAGLPQLEPTVHR